MFVTMLNNAKNKSTFKEFGFINFYSVFQGGSLGGKKVLVLAAYLCKNNRTLQIILFYFGTKRASLFYAV